MGFKISAYTIWKWKQALLKTGSLAPKKRNRPAKKLPRKELMDYVPAHSDAYLLRTISDSEAKLTELLSGKEKELFLKMVNAFSEIDGTGNVEHFIEDFRLGARIIIDVMREHGGVLRDIAE